jgi:acetylornithine deacetylase/succinyl-diaminopimelate desuccinylase-like protein
MRTPSPLHRSAFAVLLALAAASTAQAQAPRTPWDSLARDLLRELFLRAAGIPVYGVSGLFYPETGAHGMNERIPAQAFYEGFEFLYRLLRALTGPGTT